MSIEQIYPRSRIEYEKYVDTIIRVISVQTLDNKGKKDGANCTTIMNALLGEALLEASPEEVKELAKLVDVSYNKKLEEHNKEMGKTKKVKGGPTLNDGGVHDQLVVDRDNEEDSKLKTEERAKLEAEAEERERKSLLAEKELEKKEEERKALADKLKKDERKVDTSKFTGMMMMKKKDDDDFFGGGKKKGKKK